MTLPCLPQNITGVQVLPLLGMFFKAFSKTRNIFSLNTISKTSYVLVKG